jgi:nitronate monooxygenase
MRPSLEKAGYNMEALGKPGEIDYGTKLKPMDEEAKAWKTVWSAGQGCGGIQDVLPVSVLCDRIEDELATALENQLNQAKLWLQ